MKKITFACIILLVGLLGYSKEYTWGTYTQWINNIPEVVKTMPGVISFCKSFSVTDIEFDEIDSIPSYYGKLALHFDKVAQEDPKVGQLMFYEDVSNVFIIRNYVNGEYKGHFIARLRR